MDSRMQQWFWLPSVCSRAIVMKKRETVRRQRWRGESSFTWFTGEIMKDGSESGRRGDVNECNSWSEGNGEEKNSQTGRRQIEPSSIREERKSWWRENDRRNWNEWSFSSSSIYSLFLFYQILLLFLLHRPRRHQQAISGPCLTSLTISLDPIFLTIRQGGERVR